MKTGRVTGGDHLPSFVDEALPVRPIYPAG